MAKVLRCGDLMAGCQHVVRGVTEEDGAAQAAKHAARGAQHQGGHTPTSRPKVKSTDSDGVAEEERPRPGSLPGVGSSFRQHVSSFRLVSPADIP